MRSTHLTRRDPGIQAAVELWQKGMAATNEESLARLRKNLTMAIQEELTPRQREILQLHLSEGLSQARIAERLGVDKSTVSRTVGRAKRNLARVLRYSL